MSKEKKIFPLEDRVLIKRFEVESLTKGGIHIPTSDKEKPSEGEIIAVGPGKRNSEGNITPLHLKVGDKVLFTKWAGNEVKLDDEEYIVVKEADVLCLIK